MGGGKNALLKPSIPGIYWGLTTLGSHSLISPWTGQNSRRALTFGQLRNDRGKNAFPKPSIPGI